MVYRENLTTIERSPSGVVWTATGKLSRISGEVLTHRLQVTFKPNMPRLLGQPFAVDRWEYCQFSESFRQWFFRIIPPLAGAASFSAYAMVSTLSKSFSA